MKNGIPVNRWTMGIATVLLLIFGNDFVAPILKAISVVSAPYMPAM